MKHIKIVVTIAAILAIPVTAAAQDAPDDSPAIHPACAEAPFRDFDFWIGNWEVRTPDGNLAGTNRITSEENGCLLIERWRGQGGDTGQSYNYVDRDTGEWTQVWVSPDLTMNYSGGLGEDGVMRLEGRIAYASNPANNSPIRSHWTQRDDGTIERNFHQYSAQSESWEPWFTGIYFKIPD